MKKYRTTDASTPISRREEFRTHGALRGVRSDSQHMSWDEGRLPREWSEVLRKDKPYYVVYSYATPIAWFNGTHWTIPDEKYSPTTSSHQTTTRYGASLSGEYVLWENVYGASTYPTSADVPADSASV